MPTDDPRPRSPGGITHRGVVRDFNRAVILGAIKAAGQLSRADLAKGSGLSKPTVSAICQSLIDEGMIREIGTGSSAVGRKPILLELDPGGGYAVGVKLMESSFVLAVTDLTGEVVASGEAALSAGDPGAALRQVARRVRALVRRRNIPAERVLGVGVAMSGVVDHLAGTLAYSPVLHWRSVAVADQLEAILGLPVVVDNDVNAVAQSEHWFGLGHACQHFLTLSIGRGIGLGIVVHGQLYRGACGGAGEFGHVVVDPHGLPCDCGKRGCLETLASDPALTRAVAAAAGEPLSLEAAARRARAGDAALARVFADAGRVLGTQVASLINTFNPERIIIMGEGTRHADLVLPSLHEAVAEHALAALRERLEITVGAWDDLRWARAAANMLLSSAFIRPMSMVEQAPGTQQVSTIRRVPV